MFNKLFKRPDTVETYNSAPLTDERLSFLHHLRDCGYEKSSLRNHACSQLRLARLLEMTGRQAVSVARIETALHSATGGSGFPPTGISPNDQELCLQRGTLDAVPWLAGRA